MAAMRDDRGRVHVLRHRGHDLEFAAYGSDDGVPVLYFHGTPGSRIEAEIIVGAALRQGVRLVAIDRPGSGGSSHRRDRRVADWPDDVSAVADFLGLDRFLILGYSGGGPHALACLARIPTRLIAACLVAPAGHHGPVRTALERWLPVLYLPVVRLLTRLPPVGALSALHERSPQPAVVARSWRHALSRGHRGAVHDSRAIVEDWGVSVDDVAAALREAEPTPVVHIWNGARDRVVDPDVGARMAADLGARRFLVPDAGHFTILVRHADDLFAELVAVARPPGGSA